MVKKGLHAHISRLITVKYGPLKKYNSTKVNYNFLHMTSQKFETALPITIIYHLRYYKMRKENSLSSLVWGLKVKE